MKMKVWKRMATCSRAYYILVVFLLDYYTCIQRGNNQAFACCLVACCRASQNWSLAMHQITPCGQDPGMTGTDIGVSSIKREEQSLKAAAIKRLITHILERRFPAMARRSRKTNPLHLLDWEIIFKSRRHDAQRERGLQSYEISESARSLPIWRGPLEMKLGCKQTITIPKGQIRGSSSKCNQLVTHHITWDRHAHTILPHQTCKNFVLIWHIIYTPS